MHYSFQDPNLKPEPDENDLTPPREQEYNTMEGGELIDEPLRMVDQPLMPHEHFEEED